jgi:hypothetical protein
LLLAVSAPAEQGVDDERVVYIDQHTDGWIDFRQRLDRQDGVKEAGTTTTERVRDLDAHDAEVEQLLDEAFRDACPVIHLADQRSHLTAGKVAHGVTEEPFVRCELGQRRRRV